MLRKYLTSYYLQYINTDELYIPSDKVLKTSFKGLPDHIIINISSYIKPKRSVLWDTYNLWSSLGSIEKEIYEILLREKMFVAKPSIIQVANMTPQVKLEIIKRAFIQVLFYYIYLDQDIVLCKNTVLNKDKYINLDNITYFFTECTNSLIGYRLYVPTIIS